MAPKAASDAFLWLVVNLPGAFVMTYLVANSFAICELEPLSFQRIASIWIAASIAIFAFHRWLIGSLRRALSRRDVEGARDLAFQSKVGSFERDAIRWELLVTIMATLQWGYGDIVGDRFPLCGEIDNANP